ncbi:uncharacterized protein LOC144770266 [Lissotriton helveticus]
MAGLHCGLLLYVMPCLVQLTDQFGEPINCGTILGKCGTNAEISCSAGSDLKNESMVGCDNTSTCKTNICLKMTSPTQDGRLQVTWSGNTAHLLISRVQHSDAGTYCFYLKTKDSYGDYQADLQIEGSSDVPNISVDCKKTDMKIVCQATGGCPVGTIQWADGSGTNWTQSATSEEKNGVLTSTLLLQKSSIMTEYCCTVTYWLLNKTESQTRCINEGPDPLKSVDPVDSEGPNYALYILVPVAILICALLVLRIYYQRRCVHQANDVPGQSSPSDPLVLNDIEMAAGAQSSSQMALIS